MKGLGETIRELRIERGLTQPQLAEMVGVSQGYDFCLGKQYQRAKSKLSQSVGNGVRG